MDPVVARKTWRTIEPIHSMVYFVPEAAERYAALGLRGNRMGYFASRSAAMGAASAESVIAAFYNFNPDLVRRAIPQAWTLASPAAVLVARLDAVDRALLRGLGEEVLGSSELAEAAALARRAAEGAVGDLCGRPLFAAHASLTWPDAPHLVLWHAQTLLREYRGDGHIAALLMAGLDPVEALVTHAAAGDVAVDVLRATRAWPDADWAAAGDRLRGRGLLTDADAPELTRSGHTLRQQIEDQTDAAAVRAYRALGEEGCARLRQLGRPLSQAVIATGLLDVDPARFDEPDEGSSPA
jgi:hypothetical protein